MADSAALKAGAGKTITKKVCFLKTESLVRIEVFYKRFEDYER